MYFIILQLVKVLSQSLDTFINKTEKYDIFTMPRVLRNDLKKDRGKKTFFFLLSFPDAYMHLHMNGLKLSAFYQASPQPPFKKSNQTMA